jgi:hypothetical protein
MQLVLPGTSKMSVSDDGDDTVTKCDAQMGMRWLSRTCQDMGTFTATQETFYGVCGPQFNMWMLSKCFKSL